MTKNGNIKMEGKKGVTFSAVELAPAPVKRGSNMGKNTV